MDLRHIYFLRGELQGVSKRARALLENASFRRGSLGIALILSSVVLGLWAQSASEAQVLRAWEQDHGPSFSIWKYSLGAHGFHSVEEAALIQRAIRSLPMSLGSTPAAWLSSDSRWIAVFAEGEKAQPPRIFTDWAGPAPGQPKAQPPRDWHPVGSGWRGFETALGAVASRKRPEIPRIRQRQAQPSDPRAIQY
jgi:hypothetical protein